MKDRVVLITGAGKGIGKSAAQLFAQDGARVVLAARSASEIENVAEEIKGVGGEALAVVADISRPGEVALLIEETLREYGQLDTLINNAAIAGLEGRTQVDLVDMTLEDWDAVFDVNVRGTMVMCRAAIPHLVKVGEGASIINVSSAIARSGMAQRTHYAASKAALLGFTRALAHELGPAGVRVNCILPGVTATELVTKLTERLARAEGVQQDEVAARFAAGSPMKRMASSQEVAQLMVFLASSAASAMTGQCLDPNVGAAMP